MGKQAPRGNAVQSIQRDADKQGAKEKGGSSKDNVLRLPSIKSTSPNSVSCMCTKLLLHYYQCHTYVERIKQN